MVEESICVRPWRKALIVVFIFFYFAIVVLNLLDEGSTKKPLAPWADKIARATGWEQRWDMFAPSLRQINLHMFALVTFSDDSSCIYEFPRMEKLNLLDKFQHEKMRKIFVDILPRDEYRVFWPSLARFVAHRHRSDNNPPKRIVLACNWVEMPPPDPRHWTSRQNLPEHCHHRTLFVYQVRAADLQ